MAIVPPLQSGAADVIEALGLDINESPAKVLQALRTQSCLFCTGISPINEICCQCPKTIRFTQFLIFSAHY